jgi:plastocyanin
MRFSRLFVMLASVALLGAACGGGGESGGGDSGGEGGGTTTDTVTMVDNAFEPSDPAVESGSTVNLVNEGQAAHTFTLDDGSIDEQIAPGAEASVDITLDAGSYEFVCSFHPEMTGTLTVQ